MDWYTIVSWVVVGIISTGYFAYMVEHWNFANCSDIETFSFDVGEIVVMVVLGAFVGYAMAFFILMIWSYKAGKYICGKIADINIQGSNVWRKKVLTFKVKRQENVD